MRLHATIVLSVGVTLLSTAFGRRAAETRASSMQNAQPLQRGLTVSARPTLVIGGNEADESTSFGSIDGATRLPDGRILVGDRGEYSLRLFSADGKPVKRFGRKGSGPGEMNYLASLYRCGDSIYTKDIENGNRMSVFSLDLNYRREFRFSAPVVGGPPYRSACNSAQHFLQYGWPDRRVMKGGVYRTDVPFWFARANDKQAVPFGEFAGSERWGIVENDQYRGSGPLPFGKETVIALGSQRAYVGTAETYEIMMFDLAGKRVGTIRDVTAPVPLTPADIKADIDIKTATRGEDERKQLTASYASMKLPATLPAFTAFRVDAMDLLWVKDYPRAASKTVRWSVFNADGRPIARLMLPSALEVFEIGRDYLLGRYLDADEAIPKIHLYRVTR